MINKKYKYFLWLLLPILGSCIGTKHLKENEKLLYRQGIQGHDEIDAERLRELYAKKANRKILGLPISPLVGVYYWGARKYNKEKYVAKREAVIKRFDNKIAKATSQRKINNFQFRKQKKVNRITKMVEDGNLRMQWGEPIAVYDSSLIHLTTVRFHDYLFSKGYFYNTVTSKASTLGKLVSVSYRINSGMPYYIDSVFYQVTDTVILKLIKGNSNATLIKKGDKYDADKFTRERERIDLLLKDHGYYDFSRQYIEYGIDTAMLGNRKVVALIRIRDPAKRGYHKQFKIDSVIFITDGGLKVPNVQRLKYDYRNISYRSYKRDYNLKILSQRVFVLPGQLYNRSNAILTQQQLANLDAFKFVNINYDTTGGKFIANIFTSPLDRYQWSNEAGVNVTQGYPGPFDNANFKKRNVFHGLETFDLTGRFGFEGVASATNDQNIYKSTEAGINASLTFPKFLWPFKEKTLFKLGRFNPKTKLSSGYSYTDRPEYRRTTTSINVNYNWERGRSRRYDFTIASLNIINSNIKSNKFGSLLQTLYEQQGNNLKLSFNPSFVSSMIFGMTWNVNNYGNRDQNSIFLRWQLESGGAFLNFFTYPFIKNNNLQTYRYLRLSADLRKNVIINKNTTVAYRFNGGIAYSYDKVKVLPYEKYFFVGGSNSVRAWRPRRLGQGSLQPRMSKDIAKNGYFDYSFEKPGDILLEGSVELRKHLIGFIEGALFLDVGNTWTLDPIQQSADDNNSHGNSQFKTNSFYKQFGVGTGFGFRFDFSFLIIRFDIGMKVYDPARNEYTLDDVRFIKPYTTKDAKGNLSIKEPVIYNFGIGYPF